MLLGLLRQQVEPNLTLPECLQVIAVPTSHRRHSPGQSAGVLGHSQVGRALCRVAPETVWPQRLWSEAYTWQLFLSSISYITTCHHFSK